MTCQQWHKLVQIVIASVALSATKHSIGCAKCPVFQGSAVAFAALPAEIHELRSRDSSPGCWQARNIRRVSILLLGRYQ